MRGAARNRSAAGDQRSRLQRWLDNEGFTSAALQRALRGIITRSGLQRIRANSDVRRRTMRLIQRGACVLARRYVAIDELFEFYTHDEWLADSHGGTPAEERELEKPC